MDTFGHFEIFYEGRIGLINVFKLLKVLKNLKYKNKSLGHTICYIME